MNLKKKLTSLFSSKKSEDTEVIEKIWVFREPRLKEASLKNISFTPKGQAASLQVANLSSTGIAFGRNSSIHSFSIGQLIEGQLQVGNDQIEVSATIVRMDDSLTGCTFSQKPFILDRILRKYFQIEIAAMKMIPMKDEHLAPSNEGVPHCLNGDHDEKLFFLEQNGQLQYFELSFQGHYIEGNKGKPLKLKQILAEHSRIDLKYKPSTTEANLNPVDSTQEIKTNAIRFVFHMEHLDPKFRTALIEAIESDRIT